MVVNDLYISEYVIDEFGQGVGCFSSHHSDTADKRAIHRSLNEPEYVLNTASVPALDAVALFLLVGQRVVSMPFLTDDGIHSILPYDVILGFIACIKKEVLSFVILFDERLYDIGVVYTCVCRVVFLYEFGLLVCLDVILVTQNH